MPATDRGLTINRSKAPDAPIRKNYLFVVGIDEYEHLDNLGNARRDAEAVAQKLCAWFDCELADFAPPLYNEEATRSNLTKRFQAINRFFKQKEYTHNLIVYFAGHGEWDEDMETGYWALRGAKKDDFASYYSNADLVQYISAVKSHHTLIISDSCFSGGLIESGRKRASRKEGYRSREVLASGLKDQTVSDGNGKHSPFAQVILDFLEEKRGNEFRVSEFGSFIEEAFLRMNIRQEPMFAPLDLRDHQHGDFWLRPRFDIIDELNRLLDAAELAQLPAFIEAHSDELRKRNKLKYAREQHEALAWQEARKAAHAEALLDYLDQFLQTKNEHPEEALKLLRLGIKDRKGTLAEAEEDAVLWEQRYKQVKNQLEEAKRDAEKSASLETALNDLQKQHKKLQKKADKLTKDRDSWKNIAAHLKYTLEEKTSQLATKEEKPEQPQFDFPVPEMVFVKGGVFSLRNGPKVSLDDFYIGRYLVTQKEWEAVMSNFGKLIVDNNSEFQGGKLPVENASWDECNVFIKKLNAKTGLNFRFPSEAEWEFAARNGLDDRWDYDDRELLDTDWAGTNNKLRLFEYSWYAENSGRQSHPVGEKKPNKIGLFDMSGNVWEWCYDWFGIYPEEDLDNPYGPKGGSEKV
ncbi:MAG: SUMF1/EgtB/PvdO family nonheme iron enzyme, partial [Bacteroidia bacterium]